jgi:predicted dehydrogenase
MNNIPDTKGYGEEINTPNEAVITAVLEMENGITGTIHEDNETVVFDRADFTVCGRDGVLVLGNANNFGEEVKILKNDGWRAADPVIPEKAGFYSDNARGVGPAELASAMAENRPNRTDKYMALHVLNIIEAMEESSKERKAVEVTSTFEKPAPFTDNLDKE